MAREKLGLLLSLLMAIALLTGCGTDNTAREEADTITVYLWTTAMYERLASYIQSQFPDVNIQFVVGNNELDFYKFMNEHGALPDIICPRIMRALVPRVRPLRRWASGAAPAIRLTTTPAWKRCRVCPFRN